MAGCSWATLAPIEEAAGVLVFQREKMYMEPLFLFSTFIVVCCLIYAWNHCFRGCLATAGTTLDRLPDSMWLFGIDWLVLEGGLLDGTWRCTWESNTLDERSWTVFWGNDWTGS
ncbi:hypothetical protein DM860_014855 [Cuscuta australis]|uniref:Uncharacterized protein n=1 Tax=Cuscuta australis TaxID=267555 RepID=A0A328DJ46_9ASTE|nr:hypothetical protein DM860_014855 [Cuscuta australis]